VPAGTDGAGVDWAAAESDGANMEHAAASESQVGGSKCFVIIILRSSTPFNPGIDGSMITRNANWNTNWMHQQMAEPTRLLLKTILPAIGRSGAAEWAELEITILSNPENLGRIQAALLCLWNRHGSHFATYQWRKWRMPVKTMAMPSLSAVAITS